MVLSEAASFLRIAAADLATARASTDPTIFQEGAWGFWLQQAVEKALKAWLLNFGVVPPATAQCQRRRGRLPHRRRAMSRPMVRGTKGCPISETHGPGEIRGLLLLEEEASPGRRRSSPRRGRGTPGGQRRKAIRLTLPS